MNRTNSTTLNSRSQEEPNINNTAVTAWFSTVYRVVLPGGHPAPAPGPRKVDDLEFEEVDDEEYEERRFGVEYDNDFEFDEFGQPWMAQVC